MTFEQWCSNVNRLFIERVGLGRDDWPDQCYYDWWEDEVSPLEAVAMAVDSEYGEDGLEAFGLEDVL